MQNDAIDTLLDAMPELWKGRRPNGARHTLPSGHARLDERLPGGGWPIGALTEIITARPGLGELSLLLPALACLSGAHWVALIAPPHPPYALGLAAAGWIKAPGAFLCLGILLGLMNAWSRKRGELFIQT